MAHVRPARNHRPRRAGSARFSTYYKVQWYDARNCAWHDMQKQHLTPAAAAAAYPAGKQTLPHDGNHLRRPPAAIG
jgi:hypothetical protein